VGGSLTFNLNNSTFENGADVNSINNQLNGTGLSYNTNQTYLEFARQFTPAETVGLGVLDFRPAPTSQVTNFDQLRSGWQSPPSNDLVYGINGTSPITGTQPPGRDSQATTFAFDPSDVQGTAVGSIGTIGTTSFWYSNDALIQSGAIWLAFGDLTLQYDPTRAINGNSGWYIQNNLLYPEVLFDTQDISITVGNGTLDITGSLIIAPEFAGDAGLLPGLNAGTFDLSALTTVPEPSSLAMVGLGTVCLAASPLRRRMRGR
jgi:hypothetical protein